MQDEMTARKLTAYVAPPHETDYINLTRLFTEEIEFWLEDLSFDTRTVQGKTDSFVEAEVYDMFTSQRIGKLSTSAVIVYRQLYDFTNGEPPADLALGPFTVAKGKNAYYLVAAQ